MSDRPFLPCHKDHSQSGRGTKRKCPGHDGKRCLTNSMIANNERMCHPCSNRARMQRFAAAAEEEQEDESIPPPRRNPMHPSQRATQRARPPAPRAPPRASSSQHTDHDGSERCHGFLPTGNQCSNSFKRDPRATRHICRPCTNRGILDVQCEALLPDYRGSDTVQCTRRAAPTFTWAAAMCPQCEERKKQEWELETWAAVPGPAAELKRKRDAEERVERRMIAGPHRPPSGRTRRIDDFPDAEEEGPVQPPRPRPFALQRPTDPWDDGHAPYRPSKRSRRVESRMTVVDDSGIRPPPRPASNPQLSQGFGHQPAQGAQRQGAGPSTAIVQQGRNQPWRPSSLSSSIRHRLPRELQEQILKHVIINLIRSRRKRGRTGRHELWEQITDFDNQYEHIYHMDSLYRYPNQSGDGPDLKIMAHQTETRMWIDKKLWRSLEHIMGRWGFWDLMAQKWARKAAIGAWEEIVEGCKPRTEMGVRRRERCLEVLREMLRVWPLGDGKPREGQTQGERDGERLLENRDLFCPEGKTAIAKWRRKGTDRPRPGPCTRCRPVVAVGNA